MIGLRVMYPFIDFLGRQIPTYGLCMAVAILLVGTLAVRYAPKVKLAMEDIMIIGAGSVLAGLLCGFLLYLAVTYSFAEIWEMLRIGDYSFLGGGLVFYGALIGGVIGGLICVQLTGAPLTAVESSVIPYIPLGHAIGRIGCVLGGCCYGAPYEGICALRYPHSLFGLDPVQGYFPVQLLEAVMNIGIAFCLMGIRGKVRRKMDLLISYLGLYSVVRYILEFFRGDAIRGFAGGISTSQWISLGLLSICLIHWLRIKLKLGKRSPKE